MKTELIEPFYEELRRLLFKYKIKTIIGFTIDKDDNPDIVTCSFVHSPEFLRKKAATIAELFKDDFDFDIDNIFTGTISGD